MGPPSYMWSVVDRNVVMRRMTTDTATFLITETTWNTRTFPIGDIGLRLELETLWNYSCYTWFLKTVWHNGTRDSSVGTVTILRTRRVGGSNPGRGKTFFLL